ncbi:MAG: nucleotidyltransferase [Myxococcota bacterium]|nr:nucleotidyltransferase [Myxococcota bacterium]
MADSALAEPERRFLEELRARGVDFVIVGVSAALLQGAAIATQDIDLWFARLDDPEIAAAARAVGGIWVSGAFGMRPPGLGGSLGDRFDVVTHMHGLGSFAEELPNTVEVDLDGLSVRALRIERIVVSKRAAGRPKDLAHIPALEAVIAARSAARDPEIE